MEHETGIFVSERNIFGKGKAKLGCSAIFPQVFAAMIRARENDFCGFAFHQGTHCFFENFKSGQLRERL
ncbi:hypothetical protein CWS43_04950 [Rahnella sp. AA]|nr:hypothetical protein CWS43_04950 [Rahnella sp. AA]